MEKAIYKCFSYQLNRARIGTVVPLFSTNSNVLKLIIISIIMKTKVNYFLITIVFFAAVFFCKVKGGLTEEVS